MECLYCQRKYVKKAAYEKHRIVCDFNQKTRFQQTREVQQEEALPTYAQLVDHVKTLSVKCANLEKRLDEMMAAPLRRNVVKWLDLYCHPSTPFQAWIEQLTTTDDQFDVIMRDEYTPVQMVEKVIRDNRVEPMPFQCFHEKEHMFYVFTQEHQWSVMSASDFDLLLAKIQLKLLLGPCQRWQQRNGERAMMDDTLAMRYHSTMDKVMKVQGAKAARGLLFETYKRDLNSVGFLPVS